MIDPEARAQAGCLRRGYGPSTRSGPPRAASRDGEVVAEVLRAQADTMTAYRFCRSDDIALLVDALNRCWSPYFPDEPPMTPAAFKRSIRDLQVWCSSCMVAFSGSDPIGVLIGAKRPSGTLIHKIAVHPDHRRQGHGRHLLDSLGSKLAILGPPRIIAEVPESLVPACELFRASGYVQEAFLTDYVFECGENDAREVAAGIRDPCHGRRSRRQWSPWRGSSAVLLAARRRDPHGKEGRHRRTRRRLRRANRGLPALRGGERDCVAPLVHRGRWCPSEATALSTRHGDLPILEGPPGGDLKGAPGDARFPTHRQPCTLRSEGG